jgi:hypothetical protein
MGAEGRVYPGDDFVDIVGIDAYDMTPSSPDEAAFVAQCGGPKAFTPSPTSRGGTVNFQGWVSGRLSRAMDSATPGGDNPLYIERMH